VWGYDVSVTRDVREFLDLRHVGPDGFEVQGSGHAAIRTAPIYAPATPYIVNGTGALPQLIFAGAQGRLSIEVDLGPSHSFEQFTPQANAAEAAGNYWTVRTVTIAPAED